MTTRTQRILAGLLGLVVVALVAVVLARPWGKTASVASSSPTVTQTVQVEKTIAAMAEQPAPLAAPAWLLAQPAACQPGGWITVLKSSTATDNTAEMLAVIHQYGVRAANTSLKYTLTDSRSCATVGKGLWILYRGPFSDAAGAVRECNRLGWTTAAHNEHCFALSVDPAVQKGQRHIRPDGVLCTEPGRGYGVQKMRLRSGRMGVWIRARATRWASRPRRQ